MCHYSAQAIIGSWEASPAEVAHAGTRRKGPGKPGEPRTAGPAFPGQPAHQRELGLRHRAPGGGGQRPGPDGLPLRGDHHPGRVGPAAGLRYLRHERRGKAGIGELPARWPAGLPVSQWTGRAIENPRLQEPHGVAGPSRLSSVFFQLLLGSAHQARESGRGHHRPGQAGTRPGVQRGRTRRPW